MYIKRSSADGLFAAFDRGYRLLDVYEIWHFPKTSQYDRDSGEKGLFGGYVDTFLKIKQEASGFPEDCKDQEKYINDFYDAEVVKLEHAQEKKGLRALAKMKLSKTWGKLSQRDNLSKTEYITKPADYFELITCPTKKSKTCLYLSRGDVASELGRYRSFRGTKRKQQRGRGILRHGPSAITSVSSLKAFSKTGTVFRYRFVYICE